MPDDTLVQSPSSGVIRATHQVVAFGNAVFIQTDAHETILQALNRWMKYETGEYFLDAEAFQDTEAAWDKVPLIFAQEHPDDFDLVDNDIEAALQTVKDYQGNPGRLCGNLSHTAVLIPGQPRLTSKVKLTDPEVQNLYNQGKLSLSTGFTCWPGDDGHLTKKVRPNHVLVFVQGDKTQPRDKAAMFLNLQKEEDMEATHVGRVISEKNKSMFKQAIDLLTTLYNKMDPPKQADPDASEGDPAAGACDEDKKPAANLEGDEMAADTELKNQIEAATQTIAAKEAELVNKDAEIKTLKETSEALKNQLSTIEKAQKDAAWTALKNTLPPGLVDTPEKETALRNQAETAPLEFGKRIAELKMKAPTDQEGHDQISAGSGTAATNKGIGVWNAKKREYED